MYKVPKFIRREPKIVWFFTFKQFVYVGAAGVICFVLYFALGRTHLFLFVAIATILMASAFAFAFLRIGGIPFIVFLENFFSYTLIPKKYLWEKKRLIPKIIKREEFKPKPEEAPPLQIVEGSRLKELSIEVETKK